MSSKHSEYDHMKAARDVTLANGVFVSANDQKRAIGLFRDLLWYSETIGEEKPGEMSPIGGLLWDLVGYVHGHTRSLLPVHIPELAALGVCDIAGTVEPWLIWALVSLCCQGDKLGDYADELPRP